MVVSMISILMVDGALDNPTFLLSSSQQKLSISKGSSSSVATGKTLLAPAILFFFCVSTTWEKAGVLKDVDLLPWRGKLRCCRKIAFPLHINIYLCHCLRKNTIEAFLARHYIRFLSCKKRLYPRPPLLKSSIVVLDILLELIYVQVRKHSRNL